VTFWPWYLNPGERRSPTSEEALAGVCRCGHEFRRHLTPGTECLECDDCSMFVEAL